MLHMFKYIYKIFYSCLKCHTRLSICYIKQMNNNIINKQKDLSHHKITYNVKVGNFVLDNFQKNMLDIY